VLRIAVVSFSQFRHRLNTTAEALDIDAAAKTASTGSQFREPRKVVATIE
jgi:hypothetical protein